MAIRVGDLVLYTVDDIGLMLDVHPGTVRKYLRLKKMRGRKIARKWYVAEEDLMHYLGETGTSLVGITPEAIDFSQIDDLELEEREELEALRMLMGAYQSASGNDEAVEPAPQESALEEKPIPAIQGPTATAAPSLPSMDDWRLELARLRTEALRLRREALRLEEVYVSGSGGDS
jgi:hypothetical protein